MAATGEWYNSDIVCYENGRLIPQWQNSHTMKVIETGKPVVAIDTKEFVFAFPNMRKSVDSRFYSVLAYPIKNALRAGGVIVIASSATRSSTRLSWKTAAVNGLLRADFRFDLKQAGTGDTDWLNDADYE